MPNIILKLEAKGEVYWKTDSFWSLTKTIKHAKIHDSYSVERLVNGLLYSTNRNLTGTFLTDSEKQETINFYDNCRVGYDHIKASSIIDFEFIKNGHFEYKLKYDKEEKIFKLIDIRRKQKLEQIKKIMEEIV